MSPIVVEMRALGDIVRMSMINEVPYFFTLSLLILGFVLVIDFGLDIEEGGTPVSPALATVTLGQIVSYNQICLQMLGTRRGFNGGGVPLAE